ncbi:MAG TPA: hypothetical protein VMP67_04460 [Candidatus Limnocylindria bacterium]|nr:hypothetical protein [Candidatus Limnocylindria bacterium]
MPEYDIDPGFERHVAERLWAYSETALRPFDAVEIAHVAATGSGRAVRVQAAPGGRLIPAPAMWALLTALLVVGVTATAFAAGWLRLPQPVIDPSPTPSLEPGQTLPPAPTLQPGQTLPPAATLPPGQSPSPGAPPTPSAEPSPTQGAEPSPSPSVEPSPTSVPSPSPTAAPLTAEGVSLGDAQFCVLRSDGGVSCWGSNEFGQLGTGSFQPGLSEDPLSVVGISDAQAVASGTRFNCALLTGGAVRCWGEGGSGQLGNGALENSPTPVEVAGLSDAVALTAGASHACALRSGGSVVCWGSGQRLGNGSAEGSSTPVQVTGVDDALAISAAWNHTCALRSDASLACWGLNGDGATGYGGLGDGTLDDRLAPIQVVDIDDAVALDAGGWSTCAVRSGGSVWCWGYGALGGLGDGLSTNSALPVEVSGIGDARDVTVGGFHACAVRAGGDIACWGANESPNGAGQLGDGTLTNSAVPVQVLFVGDAQTVAAGWIDTCATDGTGRLWCWGFHHGELPVVRPLEREE